MARINCQLLAKKVNKIEKLARDWRAIVIDGAFTRYWFFSHFLFALTIFAPTDKKVVFPWVLLLSSFGLFLGYLSSTFLLSGIAAMFGKRFLE